MSSFTKSQCGDDGKALDKISELRFQLSSVADPGTIPLSAKMISQGGVVARIKCG